MVLSVGEKMRYEDVRNGVGKFRICAFSGGVFDLERTDVTCTALKGSRTKQYSDQCETKLG